MHRYGATLPGRTILARSGNTEILSSPFKVRILNQFINRQSWHILCSHNFTKVFA